MSGLGLNRVDLKSLAKNTKILLNVIHKLYDTHFKACMHWHNVVQCSSQSITDIYKTVPVPGNGLRDANSVSCIAFLLGLSNFGSCLLAVVVVGSVLILMLI